ncbi:sensor histidine kinase [Maribacter forsetii]|uniref:sensor histidine kinase n=1 Tax=Maribacter forsetii TaxID=444515 RepID=UPI00055A354F|nr:PAS domain-containing sensor histidine kinase [Maribacter forsetii]
MEKGNTPLHNDQLLKTTNSPTSIGIFQFDINSNEIYWNDDLKEIHQAPLNFTPQAEDLYGNCYYPDQKELLTKAHKKAINKGFPFELTYEILTQKGKKRLVRTTVQSVLKNGCCTCLHGTTIDISHFNNSQVETVQHLEQLNAAEILANSGSWKWNIITGELKWPDNFYNIFNHDKNCPISYNVYLSYIHEDDRDAIEAKFELALKTKKFPKSSYRIQLKDGTIKTLSADGKVISNEKGKVVTMIGTCQDITDSIAIKHELTQTNQQLKLTENVNKSGSWQLDLSKDVFRWTDNLYRIFEIKIGTKMSFEVLQKYIHPDDLEHLKEKFNEILVKKQSHTFSHRIISKNGAVKTVQVVSDAVTDTNGNVKLLIGTTQDISSKINRELELTQTHQQLSLTENNNEAGTWSWNPITGMFKWSENLYQIMDFDKNTPMNFEVLYTRIHPDDKHIVDNSMQFVQDTNSKCTFIHRIIISDGSIRTLEIVADIVSNEINNEKELIGTARNITSTLHLEQELQEKEELLNFAEHLTNMGYWRYKPATDDVFWSDNVYVIFDHPKNKKITFDSYFNKIHPEDQEATKLKIDKSINDHKFYSYTHRIITDDNIIKIIQIIGKVTYNNEDGLQELLGTCLDITENQTKELELAQKNHQLNSAEKMAMIGYWQWNTATNEVFWSDNLHAIYGHDKNKPLTFETYINYIHEDDRQGIAIKLTNAMQEGDFPSSTYKIQLDDGTIKIIKSIGKIVRNSKGEVLEMSGTCQDITEARHRELELLHKNHQLSLAEKMANLGSFQWQPKKEIFKWSDNHYRIYGYEPGEHIDLEKSLAKIYPPDLEKVKQVSTEIVEGIEHKHVNYRIQLDKDTIKTLEVRGVTSIDEDGNLEITGTTQDITSRVKAEQEINEKNHLLSVSEKMAMMGSWKWNPGTGVSTWSDNLYKIFGIELHTPITVEVFLSKVYPEDVDNVNNQIKNILDSHQSDKTLGFRILRDDGCIRSLELLAEVIEDQNGNILELIGTTQDVTAKIKAEEKIKEKNELLSFSEKIAKMGSWHYDTHTDKLKWSDNLFKIYGLKVNTPMNMSIFYSKIHPEDIENVKNQVKKCIDGDESYKSINFRIILNDGNILFIESIAGITKNHIGEVIEVAGTAQDITERLRIEKDIAEKNHKLSLAEELAMIGYWQLNIFNDSFIWSDNMYRIFGFEVGIAMNFELLLSHTHPEDQELLINKKNKAITTKEFKKFTQRAILDNGDQRFIEIVGKVITNESGTITEIIGSCRDITDEILSQQKILETNKHLEKSTKTLISKNKQLAEFNHITSHNLRSPVSNLNALLNLYNKTDNKDKKLEIFGKFETVIEHLSDTLNALIETITIKHNAVIIKQELSLEQILHKIKEILAAELIETGGVVTCNFTKAKNVKYNPIYLESIFLNLVSNSLKYKSPDRVPKIFISSEIVNGKVLLKFKDNGLGIDMKIHGNKIFGLNKVFHKHPEARGLGLFLTKAQIVSMGGSISVDSEVNKGTTFNISFN